MSANGTLNRSLIRRMPRNHRNMRKWWTNEWFLENRIAIIAVTRYVGNQIKEKCREMGIMFFYGGHITGSIECVGKFRKNTPQYRTEIYEKSLKVKELVRWAFQTFNTQNSENVWVGWRYDVKPGEYAPGDAWWKEKDLPWEQNFEVIDGRFCLKV